MAVVSMRQLLEAGVHFGHQTRRWNPKMKRFILGERNGIYLIDLRKTLTGVESAYSFVRDLVADGGTILFVGTKKQTQGPVAEYAEACGMPYVNQRWLGGMLTNFATVSGRVKRMQELRAMQAAGDFDGMPKREALQHTRELEKLSRNLGGIADLDRLPNAVFVIDTKKEHIAVTEARKLGLPVVAVVDTNCDPDVIDYVIPGNDDAIRSGSLMCRVIADAVVEGRFIAEHRRQMAPAAARRRRGPPPRRPAPRRRARAAKSRWRWPDRGRLHRQGRVRAAPDDRRRHARLQERARGVRRRHGGGSQAPAHEGPGRRGQAERPRGLGGRRGRRALRRRRRRRRAALRDRLRGQGRRVRRPGRRAGRAGGGQGRGRHRASWPTRSTGCARRSRRTSRSGGCAGWWPSPVRWSTPTCTSRRAAASTRWPWCSREAPRSSPTTSPCTSPSPSPPTSAGTRCPRPRSPPSAPRSSRSRATRASPRRRWRRSSRAA